MSKLYAADKIFHFPTKTSDLAAGRWSAPLHVRLKPTNRCNHRCHYCCYRSPDLFLSERFSEADEIPPAKMREVVDDLVAMGVRAVTFSGGGEPLCYPHFLDAARRLVDGGVKIAVLTNGALLAGETAEFLAQHATWVRVSLDAVDAASYAATRGVSERELAKVHENLAAFARQKSKCVLGVNFIVTDANHDDTFDFLAQMKALGVDHVKVSEAVISTNAAENLGYVRPFAASVNEQLARARQELEDGVFRVVNKMLPTGEAADHSNDYDKSTRRCLFAQCLTVLAADQNIYACQDKAYTDAGLLGSFRDRPFRDAWFAPETQAKWRAIDPSRDCRHHCVAHEKNLALENFVAVDPDHVDFV